MNASSIALVATVVLASNAAFGAGGLASNNDHVAPQGAAAAHAYDIPLVDWSVPQFLGGSGIASSMQALPTATLKSLALDMSVFTAVTPCRLVDTRGLFSPVYSGGPFAAGEIRTYQAAGNCGLPIGDDRIKAISIAITTLPASASGDVETVPHGSPLGNTVDMVAQAGEWNSVSKIVRVDSSGSFDMQIRSFSDNVAIDVNGYYAAVSQTNNDFYNIQGKYAIVGGGLLYSENSSKIGAAIRAFNSDPTLAGTAGDVLLAEGANAIDIAAGQIRVKNAGIGTSTPAFIHQVGAGNLCTDARYTLLDEAHVSPPNSSVNQMLFVQEAAHSGSVDTTAPKNIRTVFLNSFSCDGSTTLLNAWYLFTDTAFASGETYNVLLINP